MTLRPADRMLAIVLAIYLAANLFCIWPNTPSTFTVLYCFYLPGPIIGSVALLVVQVHQRYPFRWGIVVAALVILAFAGYLSGLALTNAMGAV